MSLQEIPCEILGLQFKEMRPLLNSPQAQKNRSKKTVCIATQSTAQCKYWNNPNGWQQVVDYLKSLDYEVVCIDRHENFGISSHMNTIPKNCINKTGDLPLEDRINDLMHCEFFIGLGSGLSWLAWACNKPVVMISGFSDPKSEFYTPYRVHNSSVCNGCWNDTNFTFDPAKWDWCPRNKDFECSKQITFDMVREKIDRCISDISV
jgi:autotransporter strand-loop-strand O-heptosyltransferase